jgi:hypothetical protein
MVDLNCGRKNKQIALKRAQNVFGLKHIQFLEAWMRKSQEMNSKPVFCSKLGNLGQKFANL